jgi:hypothetical protein
VPGGAEEAADIVKVEEAEPPAAGVTDCGLKEADTPAVEEEGEEDTDKLTAELKPLREEMVMVVEVPELPCWMVREEGFADMAKSGVELTGVEHAPVAVGLLMFLYTADILVSADMIMGLSLLVEPLSAQWSNA